MSRKTITEIACAQLRAYARYMDENAEAIIGNIDAPNYVDEDGIHISFTIAQPDRVPTLEVNMTRLVLSALEVGE